MELSRAPGWSWTTPHAFVTDYRAAHDCCCHSPPSLRHSEQGRAHINANDPRNAHRKSNLPVSIVLPVNPHGNNNNNSNYKASVEAIRLTTAVRLAQALNRSKCGAAICGGSICVCPHPLGRSFRVRVNFNPATLAVPSRNVQLSS